MAQNRVVASPATLQGESKMNEVSAKLKISVWRNVEPSTAMLLGDSKYVQRGSGELHQEVYSWQTKEDYFGGISDEALRASLQDKLIAQFDASRSPNERGCDALLTALKEASALVESGAAEWIASADTPGDEEDELPYMLNPLQALVLQLNWIYDMFVHQPGISILIR
jgi:hypothetical protein